MLLGKCWEPTSGMGNCGQTKKRLGNLIMQCWEFAKQSELREVMGDV
jgi:hypothetical protein